MKKYLSLFLAFILALSLCGCGHRLTEGEVYDKEYQAATTQTVLHPIVISNGKTTATILIPYVYYYPDRWIVRIREPNGDGTYTTDKYYTTEAVYNAVNIGDTFCFDPDRDFENEPYTRERQKEETHPIG